MRPLHEIIIHASATRPDWMSGNPAGEKRDEIRRWHLDRGWADIGYHDLIDRDGTVMTGRPINKVGAHCKGHNTGTIGVCLIGGHGSSENDEFEEHYTPEQDEALRKYIAAQKQQFPSIAKISGHNEYAAKACPGFRVSEWLEEMPIPRTPEAIHHDLPEEQPQGFLAKIIAVIIDIFRSLK